MHDSSRKINKKRERNREKGSLKRGIPLINKLFCTIKEKYDPKLLCNKKKDTYLLNTVNSLHCPIIKGISLNNYVIYPCSGSLSPRHGASSGCG